VWLISVIIIHTSVHAMQGGSVMPITYATLENGERVGLSVLAIV